MHLTLSQRRWQLFRNLTHQLREMGLLEPTPGWYLRSLVGWMVLHLCLLGVVGVGIDPWLSALALLVDAPVVLRLSLIVHDLGHGAGGGKAWIKRDIPRVVWPLGVGFTHQFWRSFHVRHHSFNNVATRDTGDPTTDFAPFVLGIQQALTASFMARHQAILFWLATPFLALGLVFSNLREAFMRVWITRGRDPEALMDLGCLVVGHGIHLSITFVGHGLAVGMILQLLRVIVHSAWIKISLALNHIGMVTFRGDEGLDPLTEVAITTRNFRGPMAHLFSWVLCWQIEHHLWPRMPAVHLPQAAALTREAFRQEGLEYINVPLWEAFAHASRQLRYLSRGEIPDGLRALPSGWMSATQSSAG